MNTRITTGIILFFAILAAGIVLWMLPAPAEPLIPATTEDRGDKIFSEETATYKITARYPARPLGEDASAAAHAAALEAMGAWIASTTGEFKTFAEGIPNEEKGRLAEIGRKYELGISYIPYDSGLTHSVEFDIYMDTGGAHPNAFFHTFIFDDDGRELRLSDLFKEGAPYLAFLAAETEAHVRAQLRERLGENAEEALFKEGVAPEPGNFSNTVLDGGDLLILIPPYQAASYAAGTFTVRIPLERMGDLLAPEFARR